jgi:hypothetical protein
MKSCYLRQTFVSVRQCTAHSAVLGARAVRRSHERRSNQFRPRFIRSSIRAFIHQQQAGCRAVQMAKTQPMRLIRRTARFGALPELFTFECSSCGVSHTEAS